MNVFLYTPVTFSMNSYLFSADYPLNDASTVIGQVQVGREMQRHDLDRTLPL